MFSLIFVVLITAICIVDTVASIVAWALLAAATLGYEVLTR